MILENLFEKKLSKMRCSERLLNKKNSITQYLQSYIVTLCFNDHEILLQTKWNSARTTELDRIFF